MSIRAPRAGERARDQATAEYHGGSVNFMVKYERFAESDAPTIFVISLPLFAYKHDLLHFYLEASWHRYLALYMPLCMIKIDGTCIKREENTGTRSTACCPFYKYFSFEGKASEKKELCREFVDASMEALGKSGALAEMKKWSRKERLASCFGDTQDRRDVAESHAVCPPLLLFAGISAKGASSPTRRASIQRPFLPAHSAWTEGRWSLLAQRSGTCARIQSLGHETKVASTMTFVTP